MNIIYRKSINTLIRTIAKPFSKYLPENLKFPVNGKIIVKGKTVPPFILYTNPTNWLSRKIFWDNIEGFEYNTVRVFCELVKNTHVFFDIGSNIGYYSLLASAITQKKVDVYAFEPMPSAFNFLTKNIAANEFDNIRPEKTALSDAKGEATFYVITNEKFEEFPMLTGDSGLSESHSGKRSKTPINVSVQTLDNFIAERQIKRIDLMKIDTEANEHRVLRGGINMLRNLRPIIQCEILPNQVEKEIEEVMRPFDYVFFRATAKGLIQVDDFQSIGIVDVDYYLVPKEKTGEIRAFIV